MDHLLQVGNESRMRYVNFFTYLGILFMSKGSVELEIGFSFFRGVGALLQSLYHTDKKS